jgi:hypothetical protein
MKCDLKTVQGIIDEARTNKKLRDGYIRSCDVQRHLKENGCDVTIQALNDVLASLVEKGTTEAHGVNRMRKPIWHKWRKVIT